MERMPVESLHKGLTVLELLTVEAGENGLSLADIAHRMGYKRTTAHNLLKTLVLCGYAVNNGGGHYRPGSKIGQLIRNLRVGRPLPAAWLQMLGDLATDLNESIVLTTLADNSRRVLARASGRHLVQVDTERLEDEHRRIWETVTGRVLAAFAPTDVLDRLVEKDGFPGKTWRGISTRNRLEQALEGVRNAGYAEAHEPAIASLAIPVRERDLLLGAIGTHLPEYRWEQHDHTNLIDAMRRTAARLAHLWHGETNIPVPST